MEGKDMNVEPLEEAGTDVDAQNTSKTPVPRGAKVRKKMIAEADETSGERRKRRNLKKQTTRILAQEKRRQALELRKAGATFDQIAKAVGYADSSGARKAVHRAIESVTQEPVMELRTLQIERLNHMLMVLWPKVQAGDTSAINTGLNVMNKLDALMGTEAARQVDVNVNHENAVMIIDGNKDDFIAGMKRMAGLVDPTSGQNHGAPALPSAPPQIVYPPGMGPHVTVGEEDIVEAEIVEEEPAIEEPAPIPPSTTKKKKRDWGVDPTLST